MSFIDSPTTEKRSSLGLKDDVATENVEITDLTEKEKEALYRKLDWHLLPILAILFTMSFVYVFLGLPSLD